LFAAGDCCAVDAELFIGCAERGRAHLDSRHADDALREFRAALESWRGEPLPEDLYADWSREYRERLLQAYIQALEGGANAALELGDARLAETLAARAVLKSCVPGALSLLSLQTGARAVPLTPAIDPR